jgi:integrase
MASKKSNVVARYGPATIRVTPKGTYRITWSVNNRQHERTATSLEDATSKALAVATGAVVTDKATVVFGKIVSDVLDPSVHLTWSVRTRAFIEGLARNHVLPAFGDRPVTDLTPADVGTFYSTLARAGYSKSTINHIRKLMNRAAKEAIRQGLWDAGRDPVQGVRVPRDACGKDIELSQVLLSDIPTPEQIEALASEIELIAPWFGLLIRLASGTGMRWGELIALTAADIDLSHRTIHVTTQLIEEDGRIVEAPPKTAASRRLVVIPVGLVEPLRELMAARPTGYLFTTTRGKVLRRSNWSNRERTFFSRGRTYTKRAGPWASAALASDFPSHITFHGLRHFAATHMLEVGVQPADVSRQLGHADPSITWRLYIGSDDDRVEKMKNLL